MSCCSPACPLHPSCAPSSLQQELCKICCLVLLHCLICRLQAGLGAHGGLSRGAQRVLHHLLLGMHKFTPPAGKPCGIDAMLEGKQGCTCGQSPSKPACSPTPRPGASSMNVSASPGPSPTALTIPHCSSFSNRTLTLFENKKAQSCWRGAGCWLMSPCFGGRANTADPWREGEKSGLCQCKGLGAGGQVPAPGRHLRTPGRPVGEAAWSKRSAAAKGRPDHSLRHALLSIP